MWSILAEQLKQIMQSNHIMYFACTRHGVKYTVSYHFVNVFYLHYFVALCFTNEIENIFTRFA